MPEHPRNAEFDEGKDAQPRFNDPPPPPKARRERKRLQKAAKAAQGRKVVKGGLAAAMNRAPRVSEEQKEINRRRAREIIERGKTG